MDAFIHYIKSGRSFGPVSTEDFLQMVDSGVIGPNDLVRVEGATRWSAASVVAGLVKSGQLRPSPRPSQRPSSALPAGGQTVFTTAPPVARLPREAFAPTCGSCGTPATLDAMFCKRCGTGLSSRRCGACERDNDADALFCVHCGQRLESAPRA